MNISALVLAAGKSSRTAGQHKLLLPWANKPIIAHVVDQLLATELAEVVVVTGHASEQITMALAARPVKLVYNPHYADGLSTSLQCGLTAISPNADALLIALGDMPLVEPSDLAWLIANYRRAKSATIAVPVYQGRRGNPVLVQLSHRDEIAQLRGDRGCKTLMRQHPENVLEVAMPNDHVLYDVDTMEAFQELCHSRVPASPVSVLIK